MDVIKVTPTSTRPQIEAAITALRAKQDRMPRHWHDRRQAIGDEIDQLVDQWLTTPA